MAAAELLTGPPALQHYRGELADALQHQRTGDSNARSPSSTASLAPGNYFGDVLRDPRRAEPTARSNMTSNFAVAPPRYLVTPTSSAFSIIPGAGLFLRRSSHLGAGSLNWNGGSQYHLWRELVILSAYFRLTPTGIKLS